MLMEPFFIMYLNMFIKRKQKENKMKQNKYLEKIAFLIEGITSYNVAKNKHNSENEKRHALGLHPEKTSTGRGASTYAGSLLAGAAGNLGGRGLGLLATRGRSFDTRRTAGLVGALTGGVGGLYAGAKGGNAAHRALFNESVEEALEKSKQRKQ